MRYYFHIRHNGELVQDPEGADFDTIEAAHNEAIQAAREILSERLLRGEVINGEVFEITTESGQVVATVPFRVVVRLN